MKICYIAMSIDGYIADVNGNVEFLDDYNDNELLLNSYQEFYKNIDIILMGRKTYDQVVNELSKDNWPYPEKQVYVLSKKNNQRNNEVIFIDNIDELFFVNKDKNIWILGGSKVINLCLNKNLCDKLVLTIIPKILGNGIKLFSKKIDNRLKVEKIKQYEDILEIEYNIIKE